MTYRRMLRRIWDSIDPASQDAIFNQFGTVGKVANVARKAGDVGEAQDRTAWLEKKSPPNDDVIDAEWEPVSDGETVDSEVADVELLDRLLLAFVPDLEDEHDS